MLKDYPDLLTVEQLIKLLDVSRKTAYKILAENKIKHIKAGREYRIPKVFVIDYLTLVSWKTEIAAQMS